MEVADALDANEVLGRSVLQAGAELGLSKAEIGKVIGRDRTSIQRRGVDPQSKEGELALLLVRIYRSLYALTGGDAANMRHFMATENFGTGGIPKDQAATVAGLVTVCEYVDALRGKG